MTRSVTMTAAMLLTFAAATGAQQPRAGSVRSEQKTVVIGEESMEITLGFLTVPENRSDPGSRTIEVAFARLPARPGVKGPPLVYLAGGPGDAGISDNPRAVARWTPFLEIGDVILVDQRGTGRSIPNLIYRWTGEAPVNLFRTIKDGETFLRLVTKAGAEHFRAQGVDLRGYTTNESADDINDLRIALGVEKLNLLGFSYGTHLALATVRRHGAHLENVVVIGVEGPAHTYKLPSTMDVQWKKLSLMAAADADIAAKIPDLNALLDRVLAKLDREPMVVTIRNPIAGTPIDLPIGGDGLRFIIRRDIGDASDLPVFPRLLYSIDRGDPSLLTWFVQRRYLLGVQLMSGVMDAASGVSPQRLAQITAEAAVSPFGNTMNFPIAQQGDVLGAPDLGPEFRAPLASPVRTLFVSGTLDFNTPPFQAEEVRWGFPNSSHIIVKNAGHEQTLPHPAVGPAIVRFLKGENVDETTAAWPSLRFVPLDGYDPARTHPSVPRP